MGDFLADLRARSGRWAARVAGRAEPVADELLRRAARRSRLAGERLLRYLGDPPLRRRRRDPTIERLRRDLDALGLPQRLSGRLRVGLRRRDELHRLVRFGTRTALLCSAAGVVAIPLAFLASRLLPGDRSRYSLGDASLPAPAVDWPTRVGLAVVGLGVLVNLGLLLGQLVRVRAATRIALRYTLVMQAAAAVSACAAAYRAGGERAAGELRAVAAQLERVCRGVERAGRTRGTLPRRSHRHRAVRAHGRLVVAALRRAEARLDTVPREEGLRDLAALLMTVAERHAHGRVGALLDEEQLRDLRPPPNRGVLRWIAAVALAAAVAAGPAVLDLPPAVENAAVTGGVLLVVGVLYGPSARRAADIIEIGRAG